MSKARKLAKAKPAPQPSTDTSPKVPQRPKLDWGLSIRERSDLTDKQKAILTTALDRDTRCVFIDGVWGSGKSYLSILASLRLLNTGRCDQLLYLRNPVEATTTGRIGYLKGDQAEKMAPYAAPLYDKLDELLPKQDVDRLIKENRVECIPLGFVRGRSWNCKAIVVDEASSMTWDDLLLLMSRCGEFTRIFLIGDSVNQNDIGPKAGFHRMFATFDDEDSRAHGIHTFELRETNDIVRSGFLRYVMVKTGVIKANLTR